MSNLNFSEIERNDNTDKYYIFSVKKKETM